jgi:hypothetical protein
MSKPETYLSKAIREALEVFPSVYAMRVNSGRVKVRGGYYQGAPNGTPDIIGYIAPRGRMFGLEVKMPKSSENDAQTEWHTTHAARGVYVATVRSVAEAVAVVQAWIAAERSAA